MIHVCILYTFYRDGASTNERVRDAGWARCEEEEEEKPSSHFLLFTRKNYDWQRSWMCYIFFFGRLLLCTEHNNIQVWIYTWIRIINHQQEIYKISACYWHRARRNIPIDTCIRDRPVCASATSLFTRSLHKYQTKCISAYCQLQRIQSIEHFTMLSSHCTHTHAHCTLCTHDTHNL